jgi:hypothetical protein
MAGRGDNAAFATAMQGMAQTMTQANDVMMGQQQSNQPRLNQDGAEERRSDRFMRNNPPTFKGRYDPEGAQVWLDRIERIFCIVVYADTHKVTMTTHMLAEEAEYW